MDGFLHIGDTALVAYWVMLTFGCLSHPSVISEMGFSKFMLNAAISNNQEYNSNVWRVDSVYNDHWPSALLVNS